MRSKGIGWYAATQRPVARQSSARAPSDCAPWFSLRPEQLTTGRPERVQAFENHRPNWWLGYCSYRQRQTCQGESDMENKKPEPRKIPLKKEIVRQVANTPKPEASEYPC